MELYAFLLSFTIAFFAIGFGRHTDRQPLYRTQQQIEIVRQQSLLNSTGRIVHEGWARRPIWKYNRKDIHGFSFWIKEWDYYAVISHKQNFGIAATISDLGYGALLALTYIDLENASSAQIDEIELFTFGKTNLSASSNSDNTVSWKNDKMSLTFKKEGIHRFLNLSSPVLKLPSGQIGLEAQLDLIQPSEMESINIATSWARDRTSFYLNEKVNCMKTTGYVKRGDEKIEIADAYAVLDWGRGKWTYSNRWYWSSLSAEVNGIPFGWNLGYGFSDRSPATENAIFYNNKLYKVSDIVFEIPKNNYLGPWNITNKEKTVDMTFTPIVDRKSVTNFVVIKSDQHQVFGKFSGKVRLNGLPPIDIENVYGFAEDVYNRW